MKWFSIHIYLDGDVHGFLSHTLPRIISDLHKRKLFSKYFFIRYSDPEFHIRLRILLFPTTDQREVEELVNAMLKNDISVKNKGSGDLTRIELCAYTPEISRYGGKAAIGIAEDHFYLSSVCVLMAYRQQAGSYSSMLGIALKLHLTFAFSLKLTLEESLVLFEGILIGWTPSASGYVRPMEGKAAVEEMNRYFMQSYHKQRDVLLPSLSAFMYDIYKGEWGPKNSLWNKWIKGNREVYAALVESQSQTGTFHDAPQYFQYILQSYLHMTCNRLGIYNRDEAFLAYVTMEVLKELVITERH